MSGSPLSKVQLAKRMTADRIGALRNVSIDDEPEVPSAWEPETTDNVRVRGRRAGAPAPSPAAMDSLFSDDLREQLEWEMLSRPEPPSHEKLTDIVGDTESSSPAPNSSAVAAAKQAMAMASNRADGGAFVVPSFADILYTPARQPRHVPKLFGEKDEDNETDADKRPVEHETPEDKADGEADAEAGVDADDAGEKQQADVGEEEDQTLREDEEDWMAALTEAKGEKSRGGGANAAPTTANTNTTSPLPTSQRRTDDDAQLSADDIFQRREARRRERQEYVEDLNRRRAPGPQPVSDPSYVGDIPFQWPEVPVQRSLSLVVLGTPNAGKSVLVNRLVRSKVSAVSKKQNTTREQVLGVWTENDTQLVIYDTPGINSLKQQQKRVLAGLSKQAWAAATRAEYGVVLIDCSKALEAGEVQVLHKARALAQQTGLKLILVINKVDLAESEHRVNSLASKLHKMADFDSVWMVSGLTGEGMEDFEHYLFVLAEPRPWQFPPDLTTTQSLPQRAAEIIREAIFNRTNKEVPFAVEQATTHWADDGAGTVRIDQTILVPHSRYISILVGQDGSVVEYIKDRSTPQLETFLNRRVQLRLTVRARK